MVNSRNLWLCFFVLTVIHIVNGFEINYRNSTIRLRRQSCDGFRCKQSKECISEDKECDGKIDCKDGSDESTACQRIPCPPYLFRCNYGACINPDSKCDGIQDCKDNSDETGAGCTKNPNNEIQTCGDQQFRCSSGQCVHEDSKCDGKPDCSDQSDETAETCADMKCPGFTYKCDYGACVNGNSECNGIKECYDGSDEKPSVCGLLVTEPTPTPKPATKPPPPPSPTAPPGYCVLPQHPQNGKWSIFGVGGTFVPGGAVAPGTVLQISCQNKYKLDGATIILCKEGVWSDGIGNCLALCDPIYSTSTMQVTCLFNEKEKINCTEPLSGTIAKFKCALWYEDLSLRQNPTRTCNDGSWDHHKPNCVPMCGIKSVSAQPLIVKGVQANKGDYPWQVALYQQFDDVKELICGGSLVTQRAVITAAHCVTDTKGKLQSKDEYVVVVGKYYRKYGDSRDKEAQISKLQAMYVPEEYSGENLNFLGDIAILITMNVFTLSKRVQPVCMDWGLNHENLFADADTKGYVAGWGHTTESDKPSEVLKELVVPYISYDQCNEDLSPDYQKYLTFDKLCAGYLNNGTAVCGGDSGGGLVFRNRIDGRYYLTGIVSLSPRAPTELGGCNSQQYGLYTKVSKYTNKFIIGKVSQFRP